MCSAQEWILSCQRTLCWISLLSMYSSLLAVDSSEIFICTCIFFQRFCFVHLIIHVNLCLDSHQNCVHFHSSYAAFNFIPAFIFILAFNFIHALIFIPYLFSFLYSFSFMYLFSSVYSFHSLPVTSFVFIRLFLIYSTLFFKFLHFFINLHCY